MTSASPAFLWALRENLRANPIPIENLLLVVQLTLIAITMATRRPPTRVTHNPLFFGEDFAAWLWMALSFCGDGPTEEPAQWVVSVAYDPGLNLFRRLFHRPDPGGLMQMREAVWGALRTADGIRVLDDGTQ